MLTPLDIEYVKFRKSFKGYNVEDVDYFLDQLIKDYQKLFKDNLENK